MAVEVGALNVRLEAGSAKWEQDFRRAGKAVDGLDASGKRLSGTFGGLSGVASKIGPLLAGAFSVGAVAGLARMIKGSLDAAGGLGELAEQIGVTTDTLQTLQYEAVQSGVSAAQLETSLSRLTKTIGDAANGEKSATDAFARLGVQFQNTDGSARSTEEVLRDVSEALSNLPSGAQRASAATDLFGKAGQKLLPILSQGKDGIDRMTQAAKDSGVVLSGEAIQAADKLGDAYERAMYKVNKLKESLVVDIVGGGFNLGESLALGGAEWDAKRTRKEIDALTESIKVMEAAGMDSNQLAPYRHKLDEMKAYLKELGGNITMLNTEMGNLGNVAGEKGRRGIGAGPASTPSPKGRGPLGLNDPKGLAGLFPPPSTGSGTGGGGKPSPEVVATTKAVEEQSSALDEMLARLAREVELTKAAGVEREKLTAIYDAQAAAQRDYDSGQRDSPLLTEGELGDVRNKAQSIFNNNEANSAGQGLKAVTDTADQATDSLQSVSLALDRIGQSLTDVQGWTTDWKGSLLELGESLTQALFIDPALDAAKSGLEELFKSMLGGAGGAAGGGKSGGAGGIIGSLLGSLLGSLAGSFGGGGGGLSSPHNFGAAGAAGAGGGLLSFLHFAKGGYARPGVPAIVGEEGPELMVPKFGGTILPHDMTQNLLAGMPRELGSGMADRITAGGEGGSRGGGPVTINISTPDANSFRHSKRQTARMARGMLD